MASRKGGDDGKVGNTEVRNTVHGQLGIHNATLRPREHSGGAARVHEGLNDAVLDVLRDGSIIGNAGTGGNLDRVEGLPGVGGVETTEVVDVRDHDVEVDGVSGGAVVDDRGGIMVFGVEKNSTAAQRLQEEGSARACGEGSLENRVLRVLKGLGNDLELGQVTSLHLLGGTGGQVLKGRSIPNLLANVGDDVLVLRGDLGKRDVGGAVAHGESVGAAGGTLTELSHGLGSVGGVVGDVGLTWARGIV